MKSKIYTEESLIAEINAGTFTLSFSSLKKFSVSPRNFLKEKTKPYTPPTAAMIEGSAVDCLLLEGVEVFNQKFLVIEEEQRPEPDKTFGSKLNKEWKQALIDTAFKENKEVLTSDQFKSALELVESIQYNKEASRLLKMGTATQLPVNFNFAGYPFRGIIDLKGEDPDTGEKVIVDLKKISTGVSPGRVKNSSFYEMFPEQLALYKYALGPEYAGAKCFNICVDNSGEVLVVEYSPNTIYRALKHCADLVREFSRATLTDAWYDSHDFFNDRLYI